MMKKIRLLIIVLVLAVTGCGLAISADKTENKAVSAVEAAPAATGALKSSAAEADSVKPAEADKTGKVNNLAPTTASAQEAKNEQLQQSGTAALLARTKVAQKTDQIIWVCGHELSLWQRTDGRWTEELSSYAGYGRSGLSADKREGDGATPIGCYPLLYAFGKENPGTLLPYRQITKNSWFSSALGDGTYNTWVERPEEVEGEHLADYADKQYYYAMMIGYNVDPIVENRGSAIFLHCKGNNWNTAGCVSVERSVMRTLMVSVKPGAWIIIANSEDELVNY